MPLPEIKNIELVRGQAANLNVTVPAEADLTAATIEFGIANGISTPYVVDLATSVDGQVITGKLTGAQSASLPLLRYYYSCWVTILGDPTPVARGYITFTQDPKNQ